MGRRDRSKDAAPPDVGRDNAAVPEDTADARAIAAESTAPADRAPQIPMIPSVLKDEISPTLFARPPIATHSAPEYQRPQVKRRPEARTGASSRNSKKQHQSSGVLIDFGAPPKGRGVASSPCAINAGELLSSVDEALCIRADRLRSSSLTVSDAL